MTKERMISSESLKRVIIRFDYSGSSSTGIQPWIEKIKREKLNFFQSYNEAECGSISLDVSHPEKITRDSGIGVKEMTRGPLHVFQNGQLNGLNDSLKIEISHFYMTLTINCINYQGCASYYELMCDLMASLIEYDKFVMIKRLGVRKMNLFVFSDLNELSQNLSPIAMNAELQCNGKGFMGRELIDQYFLEEPTDDVINLMSYRRNLRQVRNGDIYNFQAIIDLDCSVNYKLVIHPDYNKLINTARELNTHIYKFFENSLTEHYKTSHEKQ